MARRRFDDFNFEEDDREIIATDPADKVFWEEFWRRENSRNEEVPLVTITLRNQETGEEKVIENVRLRFRNMKILKG